MNIFEAACGAAVLAAVVPFRVAVTPANEEENTPKQISVESLTYRAEITPAENNVNLTVPADGIKRVVKFFREKYTVVKGKAEVVKEKAEVVKEKVSTVKEKVSGKVNEIRDRRAAKKAEDCPPETITIEVPAEDIATVEE